MWVFTVYFWHSEGWTQKNEALINGAVNQARTTRHLWLMACDANMTPKDFRKSKCFQDKCVE